MSTNRTSPRFKAVLTAGRKIGDVTRREQPMNSNTTWTWRLPVVLSIAALAAALLGSSSVSQAFSGASFAKRSAFAKNAGAVNGIKASRTPTPGQFVPLGYGG